MKIYFLEARKPLTKTIDYKEDYVKSPYPLIKNFTSHRDIIQTSEELFNVLCKHATQGRCLLKGKLQHRLVNEPRKNKTNPNDLTELLVLDVDQKLPNNPNPEQFLKTYFPELTNTSYVLQYSASHQISKFNRYHLFFKIKPTHPNLLKIFVKNKNIEHSLITELTADGHSPKYPIDITVNQNDKLIYIAPPVFTTNVPPSKVNHNFQYIQHIKKQDDTAQIPGVKPLEHIEIVNQIRLKLGLPRKQPKYKTQGQHSYMSNPEVATITGEKKDGNYTRLNLNNGQSWAYWHYNDQPYYLYSFKDQDLITRLQDSVPEYWAKLIKQKPTSLPEHVAFRDLKSDTIYSGSLKEGFYEISASNLSGWCNHVNIPPMSPVNIPTFNYTFDPQAPVFDATPKYPLLNRYIDPKPQIEPGDFPEIERIIRHATGDDHKTYNKFINWLACVVQTKDKLLTAWLLHGTEGTGKGLIFHNILTPILGKDYTQIKTVESIDERYDSWKDQTLLVLIDEFNQKHATPAVMDKLKYLITEKWQNTRAMRQNNAMARNYMNIILASNDKTPIIIKNSDRRWHIAHRQETRLDNPDLKKINSEIKHFAHYLFHYEADLQDAKTVETNIHKEALIQNGKTTLTVFFEKLLHGDLAFFADQYNTPDNRNPLEKGDYQKTIQRWVYEFSQQSITGDPSKIPTHEIQTVYIYMVNPDASKMTEDKFRKMMTKEIPQFEFHRFRINGNRVRGIKTLWKVDNIQDLEIKPQLMEVKSA